ADSPDRVGARRRPFLCGSRACCGSWPLERQSRLHTETEAEEEKLKPATLVVVSADHPLPKINRELDMEGAALTDHCFVSSWLTSTFPHCDAPQRSHHR